MLAHDCFYNFLPVPIMKLFTKYESNYNLRRKLTFLLPKPNTGVLRKSTCYTAVSLWNLLDNHTRAISQAKVYFKTLLNAGLHANSLVYRYIFLNRLDLF